MTANITMPKDPAIELADRLDAEDRLKRRGYEKRKCAACNGSGHLIDGVPCLRCDGKGWKWQAPLTS